MTYFIGTSYLYEYLFFLSGSFQQKGTQPIRFTLEYATVVTNKTMATAVSLNVTSNVIG